MKALPIGKKFTRLLLLAFLALASCGERAGTGSGAAIPTVIVNCTSAACRQNTANAVVTVLITQFDCDPNSVQFGLVSSSFRVNCTASSGCYGTTPSWVDIKGNAVAKISDGSYTICGRIDYLNTPFIYTDDSTGFAPSVAISADGTAPVSLTTWFGP